MNKSKRLFSRISLALQLFVVMLIMFLLGSCERDDDIQPEYGVPSGELKTDSSQFMESASFQTHNELNKK